MHRIPASILLVLVAIAAPIVPAAAADTTAVDPAIAAAVANPARSQADRARDARDRPAEVLAFAGIAPGMVVADVFGAGGYWSELLAYVVGSQGRVRLVNNAPFVAFARKDLEARFGEGRLAEVERSVVETCDLGLGEGSLDAVLIVMSYHDLYHHDPNGWPRIDAARFLGQIHAALKPGGRFLVVDHVARPGTGRAAAQDLHRIDEGFAVGDIESRGFRLEKRWGGLKNPQDDYGKIVFDPAVRGRTDRFVHLYRKR